MLEILVNFAVADRIAEASVWGLERRDAVTYYKAFTRRLILDYREFSQNSHWSQG